MGPSSATAGAGSVWNAEKYMEGIRVEIVNRSSDKMNLEFDLVHVEAPIANAIRRVLIAEVRGREGTFVGESTVSRGV